MENEITKMVGKTMVSATGANGDEEMTFTAGDGSVFTFYHSQDCCESVVIEDVCGALDDLIGAPITQAEEATSGDASPTDPFTGVRCEGAGDDSQTWTFYRFATIKGSVTVRWLGTSNGYYSESVDLRVKEAA